MLCKKMLSFTVVVIAFCFFGAQPGDTSVIEDGSRTYLMDRTGERWDITQARSIGFDPKGFEFGIGRHAFTPLDDGDWSGGTEDVSPGHRVVGVSDGNETQAYSISKLRHHEIANTTIGSKPIAAAY